MTQNSVVVIDGSNIATEGRSLPSLAQLDEAVRSFLEEYPHDQFIVVVDATFEHRIDPSERQMYDEALAANELLTPPAGTIGRGDAFILAIAEKAGATVFSNDSFQEFHGDFDWLFEEGRLIGGKPVPFIGWVFTARTPVRGQKSRQATRSAARKRVRGGETASAKSAERATPRRSATSPAANLPMPIPKGPPPGPVRSRRGEGRGGPPDVDQRDQDRDRDRSEAGDRSNRRSGRRRSAAPSLEPVNEGLAFVTFISENAVGSTVEGEVTEFSSHGAYVSVGDARCYVPLSYLGDPPPRAARDVLERGETRSFVVQAIDGPRRAIDLALPGFEKLDGVTDRAEGIDEDDEAPAARRDRLAVAAAADDDDDVPVRRRSRVRSTPAPVADLVAEVAAELADDPVVRRRTRKGPARARNGAGAPPAEAAPEAAEPEVAETAAAPRRRARKAAAPVVEAVEPVSHAATTSDDEEPAPRRRTRKAPARAAAPVDEIVLDVPVDVTAPDAAPAGAAPRRRARPLRATTATPVATPDPAPVATPRGRGRRVAVPDPGAPEVVSPVDAPAEAAPARTTRKAAAKKAPATGAAAPATPRKAATKRTAKAAAAIDGAAAPAAASTTPRKRAASTASAVTGADGASAPTKPAPAKRAAKKAAAPRRAPAAAEPAGVAKKRAPARKRPAPTDEG